MITHLLLILTDILTLMNLYFLVMKGERSMLQLIFIFSLFLGRAMYPKEFKTKKIQKLTATCTHHMIFCLPINKPTNARVIRRVPN